MIEHFAVGALALCCIALITAMWVEKTRHNREFDDIARWSHDVRLVYQRATGSRVENPFTPAEVVMEAVDEHILSHLNARAAA